MLREPGKSRNEHFRESKKLHKKTVCYYCIYGMPFSSIHRWSCPIRVAAWVKVQEQQHTSIDSVACCATSSNCAARHTSIDSVIYSLLCDFEQLHRKLHNIESILSQSHKIENWLHIDHVARRVQQTLQKKNPVPPLAIHPPPTQHKKNTDWHNST